MSNKIKVLISVLAAVVLLAVSSTAIVMAQEEPIQEEPVQEESATQTRKAGILARVAEILDIPEEDLVSAFKQAQQEMRDEACINALDKAVGKKLLTEEKATALKEWQAQKPEVGKQSQLRRGPCFGTIGNRMFFAHRGGHRVRAALPVE